MNKILFVTYGGGHAAMIIPIVKKLLKSDYCDITIIALTTAKKQFERAGIFSCLGYSNLSFLCSDDYQKIGRELIGKQPKTSTVSLDESIAYHGINYLDLIEQHGATTAKEMYSNAGRQKFYPVNFMRKVIEHIKPDLIIATNSPRSEKAIIDVARNKDIQVLCILDLFGIQQLEWMAKADFADIICVINEEVKQAFIDNGAVSTKVRVTGNPAFDRLAVTEPESLISEFRKKTGINHKKIILWASQIEAEFDPVTGRKGNPHLPLEIEREIVKFTRENRGIHLIIRPHPSDKRLPKYDDFNISISSQDDDLLSLLYSCDLVVTMTSTIGLEAFLIGKPVCTVDLAISTPNAPFSKMGISTGVERLTDLPQVLSDLLECSDTNNITTSINIGSSTQNIINEIIGLLKGQME